MNSAALERLTWDVTYHGRLLTSEEYTASLAILRDHAPYESRDLTDVEHAARIALFQCGVLRQDRLAPFLVRVTYYGRVYARQRGITVAS